YKLHRNPNPKFSTVAYLQQYPNVKKFEKGVLLHFLNHGKKEGKVFPSTVEIESQNIQIEPIKRLNKRVIVYTAVTNGYDTLRDPEFVHPDCDYVAFSDHIFETKTWRILPFNFVHYNQAKTARFVKINPHFYFSDYNLSIWVDANIQPKDQKST